MGRGRGWGSDGGTSSRKRAETESSRIAAAGDRDRVTDDATIKPVESARGGVRPKREFALLLDALAYAHFARIFFKYVLSDGVRFNAKNGDTLGSGALTPIELD